MFSRFAGSGGRPDGTPNPAGFRYAVLGVAALAASSCSPPAGTGPVAAPPVPRAAVAAPPATAPAPPPAALVETSGSAVPVLGAAGAGDLDGLLTALDRSLEWFEKPSSRQAFPRGGITHARAEASVRAFRALAARYSARPQLADAIRESFVFYASSGHDERGNVLFTGYYSPTFRASRQRTGEYRYPLYSRPADLVVDRSTGQTLGRRRGAGVTPYPTREEIEEGRLLEGLEIAWLRDPVEAYLVHVQGSAALELVDGSVLRVAYAGSNGREYVSVARELQRDGKLRDDELSLDEVLAYFESHPEERTRYLHRNPRYIFFREERDSNWPAGSLNVPLTPLRSLATDKALFPPGGVVLVATRIPEPDGRNRWVERLLVDQDAGAAITSAGRADIYYGVGAEAGKRAGQQYSEGRLYYLFIRPELVSAWQRSESGPRP